MLLIAIFASGVLIMTMVLFAILPAFSYINTFLLSQKAIVSGCRVAPSSASKWFSSLVQQKKPLLSQGLLWLSDRDSNPNKKSQNLLCYHYTIGQFSFCKHLNLAVFLAMSRFFLKNA